MSDTDVKVKFGADFSEINEGAETAVKSSGSVLSKWFGDYAKGIKDKLAKAFSLDSIVSNFIDGVGRQFEKFKEIDILARKLNVSRVELQQFAKIGKEFNMDMESMGRNIAYANRILGGSAQGNVAASESLKKLGFTQKEITSGNIKATDILYKLSEQYEKNTKSIGGVAAANILTKNTTDMFGKGSEDLVSILKEGNEAMRDRIKLMNVYSDSEVAAGANAARAAERGKQAIEKFFYGNPARYIGKKLIQSDVRQMMYDLSEEKDFKGKSAQQIIDTQGASTKFAESMAKTGAKLGLSPSQVADVMMRNFEEENKDYRQKNGALMGWITNTLYNIQNDQDKKSMTPETSYKGAKALMASSLQEIGGGDIGSVMSGLGPNDIAENTLRTAVATEHIAAQGPAQQTSAKLR